MKRLPSIAWIALCACRRETPSPPSFELREVSAIEIAKLEAALPASNPPTASDASLDERVRGLVLDRAHAPTRLRALELSDAASIGAPAVAIVDALLDERDRDPRELLSALEVLGAIDTESAADALAKRIDLTSVREPWIRAQAAFQLTKQSSDHWLPRVIEQLKYETDGETVIRIAAALAEHRNFAGLDGLRVLAADGATQEVRFDAQSTLAQVAREAGFPDAESLYAAWSSADVERAVPREEPSPRLRLELWRRIGALGAFDLKRVDDARFALSRSAWWIVEPLSAALHDADPHVRVHVAQSLERMGGRASAACSELVRALDEPSTAPAAASALGRIGCASALDALVARTRGAHDLELRNAAAAALGVLGSKSAVPALRDLLARDEPLDLRQSAARALLGMDDASAAAPVLAECLTRPGADAAGAESALEDWLARVAMTDARAASLSERWRALRGDSSGTPPEDALESRRRARARLLDEALAQVLRSDG